MTEPHISVCAVVVVYQPDLRVLKSVLTSVIPQVRQVLLINNSPEVILDAVTLCFPAPRPITLDNEHNMGIASAHNLGIRWAEARDYSHVLLLDQDSVPYSSMVSALLEGERTVGARDPFAPAAAFGPRWSPDSIHWSSFVRLGFRLPVRITSTSDLPAPCTVQCAFLISSGCLLPLSIFRLVGYMNEALFMDHVDTDWCLRAQSLNASLFGVYTAQMIHAMGAPRKPSRFCATRLPINSPVRSYYRIRNSTWLYRQHYAPLRWILKDIVRNIALFWVHLLTSQQRSAHFLATVHGLRDGLSGRLGEASVPFS